MVVAIAWSTDPRPAIRLIDQTRLPHEEIYLDVRTVDALVTAIRDLAVRGAPALGAAGALGVAFGRGARGVGAGAVAVLGTNVLMMVGGAVAALGVQSLLLSRAGTRRRRALQ